MLAVGVAVDYGRALIVRDRMADAADAAALAIGSWPGLSQAELKVKAQQFFVANYPPSSLGTVGALDVSFVGDDIKISVSGKVPTSFMHLADIDKIDIGATTVVTKKERNIELALVLDTTGSMGQGGKLSAMQSAAKKMVQTLFQDQSRSDSLKISVVPFSGTVNIGADKKDSGWIDTRAKSAISYEDFKSGVNAFDLYDDLRNRKWAGCVRVRAEPYELTDDPPRSGVSASLFAPYLAPDEPDSGGYLNSYLDDGDCGQSSGGKGSGRRGGGSKTPSPDQCQRYTGKYLNASVSGSSKGPDYNCPESAVTPLTDDKSTVTTAINALEAKGNTVIPAGLVWGWRTLSPGEPFTEGSAYNDEKWVKALVLLTDGENSVNGGGNGHDKSAYNAFGYAQSGHLGSNDGNNAESILDDKTETVCDEIKSKDILVYTIGFQVTDGSTQKLLRNCASKPDMYYNSPSNDQLAAVFQDIAQGLGELRIAQ